jgi:RNA polymerase sigma-70 factor (ECF subfamily)
MTRGPDAEAVEAAVKAARSAWPSLPVEGPTFRDELVARHAQGASLSHAADLYLALACASGDATAVRELQRLLVSELPRALTRFRQPPSFAADVRQQLLEKLVVGNRPRIRTYTGKGPLRPWLRSAAVRAAVDVLRGEHPGEPLDSRILPPRSGEDPEVGHLRRKFAGPLKAAVESALAGLPTDDRNALRFYFLEGMTVEQIASLRRVHKSNVSRLIARIRRDVLAEVRRKLSEGYALAEGELDSVLRLLQSQLHVSIERALGRKSRD